MNGIARLAAAARRRVAGRAGARSGRGVILLYHRVAEVEDDPWKLAVSPRRFREQMEMLRSEFMPMRLEDLVNAAQRRRLPPKAVAVTFDDGYRDNLTGALPALERELVPATIFVTTRYVGAAEPFWWDELTKLMLGGSSLPDPLDLQLPRGLRRWQTRTVRERQAANDGLQEVLRRSSPDCVHSTMALLRDYAGLDGPADTGAANPMTIHELRRLSRSSLIDVGAHTRTHASLPALDREIAREEVEGSLTDVELLVGARPRAFSYPFGDHGPTGRRVVRRAGFSYATGTAAGAVTWLTNPFELPRVWVEDVDAGKLAARIRRFLAR